MTQSQSAFERVEPGTVLEEGLSFAEFVQRYEGQRVEWHAGKVIQQVTNNTRHNLVQHFLARLLSWFLEEAELGQVIVAGVPMYISDDVPAREPDLMVVLAAHAERIEAQRVNGPADIVVEIVSPGSSSVDHGTKLIEYEAAGVREYWLIDPLRKLADVYVLDEQGRYSRYEPEAGALHSTLLPRFTLEKTILWQETLPTGRAIVQLVQAMRGDA